jgi:hypothetical protein
LKTHRARRESDTEWSPPMPEGMTKDEAFTALETRVPSVIPGARKIATDRLSEAEVYEAALLHLG